MHPVSLPDSRRLRAQLSLFRASYTPAQDQHIERDLRSKLADMIAHVTVKKHEEDYHITFSTDVYVLTPDELAEMIQREAMRLYSGMTPDYAGERDE